MDPKKLDPKDAFDLVHRREGKEIPLGSVAIPDIEEGFGEESQNIHTTRPWWLKNIITSVLLVAALALVCGIAAFYWFVTQGSEPLAVVKLKPAVEPVAISEEQAKKIIERNLRAFLQAETNEERLKYTYMPEEERPWLDIYYSKWGQLETPLWNIERMDSVISAHGEIWLVVYWDVQRKRHAASFQRFGDDYLLHWSAAKAFCEMPWEMFVLKRPAGPLMMRGYLRQYQGVLPVGFSEGDYHYFLIEDKAGLFSQMAVMKTNAVGASVLKKLPGASRHPVTLNLGYRTHLSHKNNKVLTVLSLKHLRWQIMSMDSLLQDME